MTTQNTLKKIGLSDHEIKVYLALLKNGRLTPARLAKICGIKRPTVYNIVKSLLSLGIIAEDLGGKTLYLIPLPLQSLHQMIDKPRRELKEKEVLIKKAVAELGLITADKDYPVPKIRFVEESELEDFLYKNFVKWNNDIRRFDFTWWGFQDHGFVEQYEAWINWTNNSKEYQDPQINAKLLSNVSSIEDKMKKKYPRTKRDIRFLGGMDFTSSIWVAGDYLIMVVTRQRPFYLFEIHDATLAHNMREVFKRLWTLTEKK